jgi:hypothetical protein
LKKLTANNDVIDTIVLGGGAWDRLHKYSSDQEKKDLEKAAGDLANQMRSARGQQYPIVWQIPTTINTAALQTDEKKENIREEQVAEIRAMYRAKGVNDAASFVLDGVAFSAGRESESYDGVHYPFIVYEGGAQILLNALDWLLPDRDTSEPFNAEQPGKMANPVLGAMILCFIVMGLFFFDGFMGASYLASLFVPAVTPSVLWEEAFATLHRKAGLPEIEMSVTSASSRTMKAKSSDLPDYNGVVKDKHSDHLADDEIEALLNDNDGGKDEDSNRASNA